MKFFIINVIIFLIVLVTHFFNKENLIKKNIYNNLVKDSNYTYDLIYNGSTFFQKDINIDNVHKDFEELVYNLLKKHTILSAVSFTTCDCIPTPFRLSLMSNENSNFFKILSNDKINNLLSRQKNILNLIRDFNDNIVFYVSSKKKCLGDDHFYKNRDIYKRVFILDKYTINFECGLHWILKFTNNYYVVYGSQGSQKIDNTNKDSNNFLFFKIYKNKQQLRNSKYGILLDVINID